MEKGDDIAEIEDLKVKGIIGFDGTILRSFLVHPDGVHVVYSLGNKVSVQNWKTREQDFLTGHTNIISAIDVSKSGKYIGSGQINHIGFKAVVILWDFPTRTLLSKHELHKVGVEAITFSLEDLYLISLGGRDCGSVVVWDIETKQPLCGAQACSGVQGAATVLYSMHRRLECFLTAGDQNLRVWKIDKNARNVKGVDVKMSKLKRVILCTDVDDRDELCYCGTSTGDIMKVRLNFHHDAEILEPVKQPIVVDCLSKISQKQLPMGVVDLYRDGVKSIKILMKGIMLIGAGDGEVNLVEEKKVKIREPISVAYKLPSIPSLKVLKSTNVKTSVTSLQLLNKKTILAGTSNCEIFSIDMDTFETVLLVTCHMDAIYDVAFPYNFSEAFATASKHDVRIWRTSTMEEILRIRVPNFSCSSVCFSYDGKSILTAWNDGIIRSFTPLTGRLIFAILNAHNKGVSALAVTQKGDTLISGGCEGQVRIWEVTKSWQKLRCTLTEHKAPVSAISITKNDDEAVSASTDGTCIIWDVIRECRKQVLFANTQFMCIMYYPTAVQILTGGSDGNISYWEVFDGSLVRELEVSSSGAINALDISPDGVFFVTGGNDQIVKLWKYQEGRTTHIGLGHSAIISAVRFSPDGKYIVSACASGGIFLWENPFGFLEQTPKGEGDSAKKEDEASVKNEENNEENISQASARSKASSKGSGKAASDKGSERGEKRCGCREGKPCCRCRERQ